MRGAGGTAEGADSARVCAAAGASACVHATGPRRECAGRVVRQRPACDGSHHSQGAHAQGGSSHSLKQI
eukprot:1180805-Prorocentrum_minimum.AAC.1